MTEKQLNKIISEYGLEDNDVVRDALTETFMSGALAGRMDSDIFNEALEFFGDEDE